MQWKSGQLCLVLVRPDRPTTDIFFSKIRTEFGQRTELRQTESGQNPDSGQTPDSSVRKIRITDRHRTDSRVRQNRLSTVCPQLCPCPRPRPISDRHRTEKSDRIQVADRHRTRFSGKSGQNETRTGHGQSCPPTSVRKTSKN